MIVALLTVIRGEFLHQHRRKIRFPSHENPTPRHEHLIKDGHDLLTTEALVADVDVSALQFTGVGSETSTTIWLNEFTSLAI